LQSFFAIPVLLRHGPPSRVIGKKLAINVLLVNGVISANGGEYVVLAAVEQNARQAK
jgi:hypothetical protein